jgi:hypothetical protein
MEFHDNDHLFLFVPRMIVFRIPRMLPRVRRKLLAVGFAFFAVLLVAPDLAWAGTAYMQYSTSPPNDFAGTAGAACVTTSTTYAWPDINGNVLKCVSNVWQVQSLPALQRPEA